MTAWIAALLLATQAPASIAGIYQTQQMEVGATLELREDGTFRYMLDYGAVSEAAEGHCGKSLHQGPLPATAF